MLQLGEVDFAIAGGVSESIHTFRDFRGLQEPRKLAEHEDPNKASRPFDAARNGIVVSEGGALFTLERLDDALARGAKIYGEIVGYHVNSDATDYVLPNPERQTQCMRAALKKAKMALGTSTLLIPTPPLRRWRYPGMSGDCPSFRGLSRYLC